MTGYSKEFRAAREAEQRAADAEQKERKRQNALARKRYLDRLEAERQMQRDEHEAKVEQELAPMKTRLQRQWLVDHPDKDASDFEAQAWPLLRANLLEDRREHLLQNAIEYQRRRMGGAS
jgi:ribosomal protein L20